LRGVAKLWPFGLVFLCVHHWQDWRLHMRWRELVAGTMLLCQELRRWRPLHL
jgi:hypothetical protein